MISTKQITMGCWVQRPLNIEEPEIEVYKLDSVIIRWDKWAYRRVKEYERIVRESRDILREAVLHAPGHVHYFYTDCQPSVLPDHSVELTKLWLRQLSDQEVLGVDFQPNIRWPNTDHMVIHYPKRPELFPCISWRAVGQNPVQVVETVPIDLYALFEILDPFFAEES